MDLSEFLGEFWSGVICAIGAIAFLWFVWRVVRHEFGGNWIVW